MIEKFWKSLALEWMRKRAALCDDQNHQYPSSVRLSSAAGGCAASKLAMLGCRNVSDASIPCVVAATSGA